MKTFIDLGVPKKFADKLSERGIASPFEIQEAALPDGLAGLDVCGKHSLWVNLVAYGLKHIPLRITRRES